MDGDDSDQNEQLEEGGLVQNENGKEKSSVQDLTFDEEDLERQIEEQVVKDKVGYYSINFGWYNSYFVSDPNLWEYWKGDSYSDTWEVQEKRRNCIECCSVYESGSICVWRFRS